jgi:hypothetical protein
VDALQAAADVFTGFVPALLAMMNEIAGCRKRRPD